MTGTTLRVTSEDTRTAWRSRCPRGHASVVVRKTKDETECRACGLRWRGQPFDARRAEFPVAPNQYETPGEDR